MVPHRESEVRLLEEDIGQYGSVLYENSEHFNELKVKKTKLLAAAMIIMGIFVFIIPIFGDVHSPRPWFGAIFIGIMFLIIGYIALKEGGGECRIHEKGIRFSFYRIPFISFEEIDHIEKGEGYKRHTPYISIVTHAGKTYNVSSGPMKHVHETPENYNEFLRILEKKLLETQPNENPVY